MGFPLCQEYKCSFEVKKVKTFIPIRHKLLIIFANMANKSKKNSKNLSDKPARSNPDKLKPDKEEKVHLKKLARDERTWKIIGSVFLLISIFLFISFVSYFFTWKEDFSQVKNQGLSFLINNDARVNNLLGRLGAFVSHFFIYNGFGIASMLICTFFF